ncbi:hypothetical protein GCM10009547_45400 [Sporichthya brevicatena]|uniref:HTH tetR-type domain-containing protein n=1 Tax=Sporichthya brevicatena TaxID=171442 RepID=A0ABN1HAY8_9ACTN
MTRARILKVARTEFGQNGYSGTTTKAIAEGADLTIGALYYYFPTKHDLFLTVYKDVFENVTEKFETATDGVDGLAAKICAIMDVVVQMNVDDPSLATFASVAPIEIHRHEGLAAQTRRESRALHRLFEKMIASAPEELAPDTTPEDVVTLLMAMMAGLSQMGATASRATHRQAADAFKKLLHGHLLEGTGVRS